MGNGAESVRKLSKKYISVKSNRQGDSSKS